MSDSDPTTTPPAIPEFPPSLLRAAEHLKAKFQELPWFVSVQPASREGRICLLLGIREQAVPRSMVLPTSFETFRVVIDKLGNARPGMVAKKSKPVPLW
jgi:hypothetical protein